MNTVITYLYKKLLELLTALIWFSSLAFFYFGISCFYSEFIVSEFIRYGLQQFRKLTGLLQIMGAMGLLIGLYFSPLTLLLSALGLGLLMLAGFIVRLKIRDNFLKSSPAFTFAAINLFIAFQTYSKYF